ncbi:FAD:protein FMN transferase [Woeseia oceani]|nr:FAD:protein FMN transferase [Woeseia oceani]
MTRMRDHWRGQFRAMASPCEVLLRTNDAQQAEAALSAVAAEAWRIEDKFSRYRTNNVVAAINDSNGATVAVDDETANLIDFATALHELSEGRFDISSGVLRRAWQFDGSDRLPDEQTVADILSCVGWNKVLWQRPDLTLQPGMQIDFGGIGKEYAVDRAAALAADLVTHCLINFGGDLATGGASDASPAWQVGVETPDSAGRRADRLIRLSRGGLATSGDARRFLLKDGKRYSHILNPLTGWPIEQAPRSVTVAADTCTQAGMLATLAMLQGPEAESFLEAQSVQYWCRRS